MKDRNRLKSLFESICKDFFPQWDNAKNWRSKLKPRLPSRGLCCHEKKEIQIRTVFENEDELDSLLIHEICHAIAPGNHTKRWNERMVKASKKADELGRHEVASLLSKEVEACKDALRVNAKVIYERIEDIIWEVPDATFNGLFRSIAKEHGMYKSELLSKYTQCRKVFDRIKREVSAEDRRRREFFGEQDKTGRR